MINVGALKAAIGESRAPRVDKECRQRSNNQRVTFELTAEVDAETLLETFGERYAIVIYDGGMTPEDARRIGLESLRKSYRVFKRGAESL